MCFVIKTKMIRIMKNPIYFIGLIAMLIFVYIHCVGYLDIKYLVDNSQIKPVEEEQIGDADVMDGYIPMTDEEYYIDRMYAMKDNLINNVGMDEDQVDEIINTALNMERQDAIDYLEKECPFVADMQDYFNSGEGKKLGTAKEINGYITEAIDKEDFMDYFGRKYSDYLGIVFVFFCLIIFPFYFAPDNKKDTYELLHTKPISCRKYILSQLLGSILVGLSAVVLITLIAQGFVFINKDKFDFAISTAKIWKYTLWCMLPAIIYISAVFLLFSILFKSPFPAIPLIFIQILFSNAGVTSVDGKFSYIHRPGAITIRYPELFFETHLSDNFYPMQVFLIALGVIVAAASVVLWEKKRV
ncbi:MAG: ABC transporter permease [Ruminococcus sp.]|uniref:ABC transporter permease subunit n=1 Tax=Ruminococcus sp. TaxID=41978 RepID=UPI0025D85054|nr:ABC transporter permease [Ruminococcus sp.]MCR5541242.1 ABC transporter permease [Ruminococcus sp.]